MGKAARRRMQNRSGFLRELAEKDPQRFREEWAKRLDSWRGKALRDADVIGAPSAFQTIEHALEQLASCGPDAMALEGASTRETMAGECAKAVARAVGKHMYRLGNTDSICQRKQMASKSTVKEGSPSKEPVTRSRDSKNSTDHRCSKYRET